MILAGNRDEFHDRPAQAAHWWEEPEGVLAGRDLQAGGSWLGIHRGGRFAVVTNYREPGVATTGKRSRGELVTGFLASTAPVDDWMDELAARREEYGGYNLIIGDGTAAHYLTNRGEDHRDLGPGIYGLSNHRLDTPWPKVSVAREGLRRLIGNRQVYPDAIFDLLSDRTLAPDPELPDTGVPLVWERLLSSVFVVDPRYGTRAGTVVLAGADGTTVFEERRFGPAGDPSGASRIEYKTVFDPRT